MKSPSTWIRDLHLYLGLFISPFLLVFAISTLFLNHRWKVPPSTANERTVPWTAPVEVSGDPGSLEQGTSILRQLNLSGEIDYIRHFAKENRLMIPVTKPGERTTINVDLKTKTASVERRETGIWDAMIYLHRMPGPHNVKFRGNWIYTRWWGVLSDATVYAVLFLTLSGQYLWLLLKAERKLGLILLGAGVASFLLIGLALTRPSDPFAAAGRRVSDISQKSL